MKKIVGLLFLSSLMTFAAACGGSSGPSSDELVVDLSSSDATDVCTTLVADAPQRTVDCSGTSTMVGFASVSDCETQLPDATTDPDCTLTVGEVEDCADALDAESDSDICAGNFPTECAPVAASSCEG